MPDGDANGAGHATSRLHDPAVDLPLILGKNLKRLRRRQGYSLDRLSQLSGVSRAMIGQIETAKSVPTISLLSKVAKALNVEFANLLALQERHTAVVLRADRARVLNSSGGLFASRTLHSPEAGRSVEFHEIRVAPLHCEESEAHAPGTRELLVVVKGVLAVRTAPGPEFVLNEGDAIEFDADAPHSYRNAATSETVAYVVTFRSNPIAA